MDIFGGYIHIIYSTHDMNGLCLGTSIAALFEVSPTPLVSALTKEKGHANESGLQRVLRTTLGARRCALFALDADPVQKLGRKLGRSPKR